MPELVFKPLYSTFEALEADFQESHELTETMLAINEQCPIKADYSFMIDRSPDFFAWPEHSFSDFIYQGVFAKRLLVGYGLIGFFQVWDGHRYGPCFYLGDARVLPAYRGQHAAQRLFQSIETLAEHQVLPRPRLGLMLIKRGNHAAMKQLQYHHMQGYQLEKACRLDVSNLLLLRPFKRSPTTKLSIRLSRPDDAAELCQLMSTAWQGQLFAPCVTPAYLARNAGQHVKRYVVYDHKRMVATLCLWDMDTLHRTKLLALSHKGKAMHWLYRLLQRRYRAAPLPILGSSFKALTVTDLAVANDDPQVLRALLRQVYQDHLGSGYHMIHLGLIAGHPLEQALDGFIRQDFNSDIYLFYSREQEEIMKPDERKRINQAPWQHIHIDLSRI